MDGVIPVVRGGLGRRQFFGNNLRQVKAITRKLYVNTEAVSVQFYVRIAIDVSCGMPSVPFKEIAKTP